MNDMTALILLILIVLYGYFSLAEIALISVTQADLTDPKHNKDKRAAIVKGLIENPEEFLSAVQVGMTLVGMLEGIYGGGLLAEVLEQKLITWGMSAFAAKATSLTLGIGTITYVTIVFGELVPKSIALQMPMKVSLAIAPSLRIFSKLTYPIIKLLTVSTHWILNLLGIKRTEGRKVTEQDLKLMLSTAYQQGLVSKQQFWLHQNVTIFDDLTAERIMKPEEIVKSIPDHWSRDQVMELMRTSPYSYFPVYKETPSNIIGIVRTKSFLLSTDPEWKSSIMPACFIISNTAAKDIFEMFKKMKVDFGIVFNLSGKYVGIVAMQDIMEGVFGDMPEYENYNTYFYNKDAFTWLAEGFIHLQRVRNDLNLPWLREYEFKYVNLSELIKGETGEYKMGSTWTINGITFTVVPSPKDGTEIVEIKLASPAPVPSA